MTGEKPGQTATEKLLADGAQRAADVPDGLPGWARELAEAYVSGSNCLFILHGNVHDLLRPSHPAAEPPEDGGRYRTLVEVLGESLFGSWDVVLRHDLGSGFRPLSGNDPQRLQGMMQFLAPHLGPPAAWPRSPDDVLHALDRLIERNLLEQGAGKLKSIAVVFEYAQFLLPAADLESLAARNAGRLVRFLQWAQNPYIKRVNIAFCLIADKLAELNARLVESPHSATIEIPMPHRDDRREFVASAVPAAELAQLTDFSAEQLADLSNGLNLVDLDLLLTQARRSSLRITAGRFKSLKKEMLERQCQGLLEFIEPAHSLDLVVGHEAAKKRLREDAALIARGRLAAAPMGYLLCGAVGTGKTFLAECYAGSIGIPCVKLRNFRSKYVGETEGNLERVLEVLRALGPVVVMIDEADAALGTREAEGDSGTSSRVFSMVAAQMGDTQYRGRIIWMLMTSRPDRLPIDLKRQGRAEVHIPLFYPEDENEVREMFVAMGRKNRIRLSPEDIPPTNVGGELSGADIESVVLSAWRKAMAAERTEPTGDDLASALAGFIPSAQGLEKTSQEIAAVLECTDFEFLPPRWREIVAQPDGRAKLQSRLASIRELID
ncbi:MAG: AAA family ATPase [Planctomycetales bacterium]